MDKHALPPPAGASDRGVKQARLWGNTKEATTFTVAFSMDRGPLDMLIVQAVKTDVVLPEEHSHHVTSENGWAITATTILQFTATLDNVLNPSKEGQSWILFWDMASIFASEGTMTAMAAAFPHVVLCVIAPRSTQASATLARIVLDGSFEGLAMNKAWWRQSSADWAARAVTDLCDENKTWTTGWHRLRAGSNAEFREAVAEAAALHAHDELFSKHIEPEPAPEDPVEWAMAEASDDEDDAPMPDAPPEPEMIDMPLASARPMSNLERCIALRLVATRRNHRPKKIALASYHIVLLLSHVSVVPCVVSLCCRVRWCPAQAPRQCQEGLFFCLDGLKKVLTQGDFCAVL